MSIGQFSSLFFQYLHFKFAEKLSYLIIELFSLIQKQL